MAKLIRPVVEAGTMSEVPQPDVVVDDELALRPWRPTDAPLVVRAFSVPDIQHWHFRRYDSIAEAEGWIDEVQQGWRAETAASWAISRPATDEVVGRIALYTSLEDGHGEVSYWVVPEARGENIAARATVAVTRWAHDLGLHRVQLQLSTGNEPSARVALKAGFTLEGVRRGANLHDDGWNDMRLYSHLATD